MSSLPTVNPEACIKALQKAGFAISRQKGSHVQMRRNDPQPARTVPIPISKNPYHVAHYVRSFARQG